MNLSVDLGFTRDPVWIAERQSVWEKIKPSYSEGFTRKQRDKFHEYFMTGVPPKKRDDFFFGTYVVLFPLQTWEGLAYCFHHFVAPEKWGGEQQQQLFDAVIRSDREDLSATQKKEQFLWFMGEQYDPARRLPFLVGDEKDFRPFYVDPVNVLWHFEFKITDWLALPQPAANLCVEADLLDYFFSLFIAQPEGYLAHTIAAEPDPDADYAERRRIGRVISSCQVVRNFLRTVWAGIVDDPNEKKRSRQMQLIEALVQRFNQVKAPVYPQELVDHWEWIKRKKFHCVTVFEVNQRVVRDFASVIYYFSGYSDRRQLLEALDEFKPGARQEVASLLEDMPLDSCYHVNRFEEFETETRFKIFTSAVSERFPELLEKFLLLCGAWGISTEQYSGCRLSDRGI